MAAVFYRTAFSLLFELSDKRGWKSENEAGPNYTAHSNTNYLAFRCLSLHDALLLLLLIITTITTATTAMAMITMLTTTPAATDSVEVVVLVPEEGDVRNWHSGSLKDVIRTGHVGSISTINPSTTIETSPDIHQLIRVIISDAFVVAVPYSLERNTT